MRKLTLTLAQFSHLKTADALLNNALLAPITHVHLSQIAHHLKKGIPEGEVPEPEPHPICSSCRFFHPISTDSVEGECRRRTPFNGGWPAIKENDWCGEFSKKEEQ